MAADAGGGRGIERAMPLAGIAFAVLGIAGTLVLPSGDPGFMGEPAAIARYYGENSSGILAAQAIYLVSGIFLLWFVAALRSSLSGSRSLTQAITAGGVAGAALMIGGGAMEAGGALRVQEQGAIPPQIAAVMHDSSQILFGLAAPMAWAAAVLAVAAVILRSRALPGWLGYLSAAMGVALAIPPINHVSIIVFHFWAILMGAALFATQPRAALDSEPAEAAA